MVKESLFRYPVLGYVLRKLRQIPVARGSADAAKSLKHAEEALREGACVVVYPEGTVTRDPDLWPMVGKTGVARLALATGVPVIPVAHWGAQELLPYGKETRPRLLPRKTFRVLVGPPVDLSKYQGQPIRGTVLREATADIMAAITAPARGAARGEGPRHAVRHEPRHEPRRGAAGAGRIGPLHGRRHGRGRPRHRPRRR